MHPPANIVLVEIVNIGVMEIANGILQFKNVLTKVSNIFVEFSKISGKTSITIKFFCHLGECLIGNPSYIGDNYCDDENNNENCNFDGGDCCLENVNTQYCSECECKVAMAGKTS